MLFRIVCAEVHVTDCDEELTLETSFRKNKYVKMFLRC